MVPPAPAASQDLRELSYIGPYIGAFMLFHNASVGGRWRAGVKFYVFSRELAAPNYVNSLAPVG